MSGLERVLLCVIFTCIAICAIAWLGKEYFALLACFNTCVGILIGMTLFVGK